MLLSSSLLERTATGKRILRGSTLGQPVELAGAKAGSKDQALFEDARLRSLFDRVSASGDPQGVAQCILSELTNLYMERPEKLRTCAVLWPSGWRPSRQVLNEVMKAISGAPWLRTATFAQSIMNVPSLNNDPLDIPDAGPPSGDYFSQVAQAAASTRASKRWSRPTTRCSRQWPAASHTARADVWRQWNREIQGLSYASWVTGTVDSEVAKITVPQTGSYSVTSSEQDDLTVRSSTGRPTPSTQH